METDHATNDDREGTVTRKLTLDSRFVRTIDGRDFVLYAGLLDLAHQKGLQKIQLQVLQIPDEANHNTAIVQVGVESVAGEVFSDVGDANPENCSVRVGKHLIRMASTRAKARALRDFTNVGITCLEELGGPDDVVSNEQTPANSPATQPMPVSAATSYAARDDDSSPAALQSRSAPRTRQGMGPGVMGMSRISPKQHGFIMNLLKGSGLTKAELNRHCVDVYGVVLDHLTKNDASNLIETLMNDGIHPTGNGSGNGADHHHQAA